MLSMVYRVVQSRTVWHYGGYVDDYGVTLLIQNIPQRMQTRSRHAIEGTCKSGLIVSMIRMSTQIREH